MTYAVERPSCDMILLPSFMKIGACVQTILRYSLSNLNGCKVGITGREGIMNYTVEIVSCGMIYIPSFIKIGTSVQALLRFSFGNLRGCNVGITDGGI
jgi:hypothetical protein